jgi:flagellar hook-basal body complex protein FliE
MSTIEHSQIMQMRNLVLGQNSALKKAAGASGGETGKVEGAGSFGNTLTDALKAVSDQQAKASNLSAAYERGDTNDVVGVMIERQKASLGFEATLQVRNKLLSAYRDIMNMPV